MRLLTLALIPLLIFCCLSQKLYFHSPQSLKSKYSKGIDVKLSPIGYHPRSGQLDGTLVMAQPFDGCFPINNVENSEQDVFVMVDDQTCLQSTKSKNILSGGGMVGIIKQNENTTLHDKDVNIVHIPIVEMFPQTFDQLVQDLKQNVNNSIVATLQFSSEIIGRDITIELWMSPTETQTYEFLISMESFLNNEINQVKFNPRYGMHSQKQRKTFIGCYSNGMYCPGEIQYDGKLQGQNVIEQTLRQITIRDMDINLWWKYIKYYYVQCLRNSNEDVMMDSKKLSICSKNSMMLAEIDYKNTEMQMAQSFLGPRKQVDDNVLLRQQRQDYIREKITVYPAVLINKKQYNDLNQNQIKLTICKIQRNRSKQCSEMLDGDLKNADVLLIVGIVIIIVVGILAVYKFIMYRRMQTQMKSEVTSTLEQYYRYMDTLDGDNAGKIHKTRPDSSNNIDQEKKKRQQDDAPQVQIQLGSRKTNFVPKSKPSKEGHQTLVQE